MSRVHPQGAGATVSPGDPLHSFVDKAPSDVGNEADWGGRIPHVLILDDEEALRDFLKEVLTGEGYRVSTAGDWRTGLALLSKDPPDLVLTDLKLPDTTGLDVLEQVRRIDRRARCIVMSGYGSIDLAVQAMKEGAVDFITKPFKPDVVVLTLRRVLELARLRQENAVLKGGTLRASGVRVSKFELQDIEQAGTGTQRARTGDDGQVPEVSEYERGLADGEKRTREKLAVQTERQHALLAQVVKQIEQASVGLLAKVEEQVAGLAFEIARKVIYQVAEERRELVLSHVQQAVARIRESAKAGGMVRVRVHPTDLPFLEAARDTIAKNFDRPVSLAVESDAAISPGGCRVETDTRLVDATLEAQLLRLGEALKRREPRVGA